jgi:hypothetical protein
MSRAQEPTNGKDNQSPLPKPGDRVGIAGRSETFIVIAVDEKNASVSLQPVSEPELAPVEKVICLRPPKSGEEGADQSS